MQHTPWLAAFVLARRANKDACRNFPVSFPKVWPGTRTTFPAQSVPFTTLNLPSKVVLGEPAAERAPSPSHTREGLATMQQLGTEEEAATGQSKKWLKASSNGYKGYIHHPELLLPTRRFCKQYPQGHVETAAKEASPLQPERT